MGSDWVRIESLRIRDYGVFRGENEFTFNLQRTVIAGPGGTGKTTLFNALANLGAVQGVMPNAHASVPRMFVEVVTSGNRALLKVHRDIIFLRCESLQTLAIEKDFSKSSFHVRMSLLEEASTPTFHKILQYKPHKLRTHHDLDPKLMASGERFCLGLSLVFAIRKATDLDLPIVMDSPYGWIDKETRKGLSEFLKRETCQQIMLGSEAEFSEVGDRIAYSLDYANGGSLVVHRLA